MHRTYPYPVTLAMSSLLFLFILSDGVLTPVTGTFELTVVKNIIHGPLNMTSNYSPGHTRYDPELFRVGSGAGSPVPPATSSSTSSQVSILPLFLSKKEKYAPLFLPTFLALLTHLAA